MSSEFKPISVEAKPSQGAPLPQSPASLLQPLPSTAYRKHRLMFFGVVLCQVFMMLGSAVPAAVILENGATVTLKTKPVDPYDVFRGDYVRLNYEMNNLRLKSAASYGQTVYTVLKEHDGYWEPQSSSTTKPISAEGEVVIAGKYKDGHVNYGIEQVFVREKTGREAEKAESLTVQAKVDGSGRAIISKVTNAETVLYDAGRTILGAEH